MSEADAPIRLVVHDPRWAQLFHEERGVLQRVLAPWLAGPIEHIGSTAVPGLPAKPVIDLMAAVETLERSRGAIIALQEAGYSYAPYRAEEEHWFCKPHASFRTHHLHLVPYRSAFWNAHLLFRDRLRQDHAIAAEYLDLKQRLAKSFAHDREAYTDGKSAFIARVVNTARQGSPEASG